MGKQAYNPAKAARVITYDSVRPDRNNSRSEKLKAKFSVGKK
jgi:hypothetical protein